MLDKKESNLYKKTKFEFFKKKNFDYSIFDYLQKEGLDKKDTLLKFDWKNVK